MEIAMLNKFAAGVSITRIIGKRRGFRLAVVNLAAAAGLCVVPAISSADTIFGLHGSMHMWKPELGGTIGQSNDAFDFTSEFSDNKGDSLSVMVAVEHPIPLVPNFQARITPLEWTGASESASGSLGGVIDFTGEVEAKLDMEFIDGTLYYEILDNWVTLDLGLTARQFEGFIEAKQSNGGLSDRVDIDQILPMLYGHARFDLPFSGLAAGVRANAIAYKEHNLIDAEAYIHLEVDLIPMFDVGIQGGLRRLSLDVDDVGDWNSDASLEGAYIALTGHF